MPLAWPYGAATGVGSLPGTDPAEAARTVAGELPDLPHLAELPDRGPGADLVGRGAALLAGLYVDLQPAGWRFVARPGLDHRRALDHLARDLDATQVAYDGYAGLFKVQVAGPWTLAANVELPRGDRALSDATATNDVAQALAEGLAEHVRDIKARIPNATVVAQLDEPSLPAVAVGHIRTASGFGALRAVGRAELLAGLRTVITNDTGVHCCANDVPFALLAEAGAAFVSFDLSLVTTKQYDDLAALVDRGVHLLAGTDDARALRTFWRNLSYPPDTLARRVVVTPACGLAGRSPDAARAALARAREVARDVAEEPEEDRR